MRHHGKAGQEVVLADGKSGDIVIRIGNQAAALGKLGHAQADLVAVAVEAVAVFEGYGFDIGSGLRVQRQRQTEGFGSGLAGVVVGRAADAAGNKGGQAFGKALAQAVYQDLAVVGQVLHGIEQQAALFEQLFEKGKMFVLAAAMQDFVADDDEGKGHGIPWK